MLIVLMMAIVLLMGSLILSAIVPHPITWLMTVILAFAIVLFIWPKYQAEQAVAAEGVWVEAKIVEIRAWDRKIGDGNLKTQYEVVAQWLHPDTGKTHRFVSAPLSQAPRVAVNDVVRVNVVWPRPEQYKMDTAAF